MSGTAWSPSSPRALDQAAAEFGNAAEPGVLASWTGESLPLRLQLTLFPHFPLDTLLKLTAVPAVLLPAPFLPTATTIYCLRTQLWPMQVHTVDVYIPEDGVAVVLMSSDNEAQVGAEG